MAHGRRLAEWDQTAALLAMIFNANRDPKRTEATSPRQWHPYRKSEAAQHLGRMTMRELYEVMFRKQPIPVSRA